MTGIAKKLSDTTIEITEWPIHKWTQNYNAELEVMMGEKGDGIVKVRLDNSVIQSVNNNSLLGLQRIPRQ